MQPLTADVTDSTVTLLKRAASLYLGHPRLALIAMVGLPVVVVNVISRGHWWLLSFSALLWFAVSFFVVAALAYGSGELLAGREPGILDAYRRVALRCRTLLGVMLAHFLGVALPLGTLVGIPVGLYLLVRWWFGPYAAVLNDVSTREALRISSSIVKGAWWQMFGRTVALMSLLSLSVAATGMLLGLIEPYLALIPYIVGTLLLPLSTAFYTLLFLNAVDAKLLQSAASPEASLSP